MITPAGWYPDSVDALIERYWDGSSWTDHTRPTTMSPNTEIAESGFNKVAEEDRTSGLPTDASNNGGGGLGDLFAGELGNTVPSSGSTASSNWLKPPAWSIPDAVESNESSPWAQPVAPWVGGAIDNPGMSERGSLYGADAPAWARGNSSSRGESEASQEWWSAPTAEMGYDDVAPAEQTSAYDADREGLNKRGEVKRGRRGGAKRTLSRLSGIALVILALMVWVAEDDREKLADSTIGTQIPITDTNNNSLNSPTDIPSVPSSVAEDGSSLAPEELNPSASKPPSKPVVKPTPSPVISSNPAKRTPGILDPTLLPPDTYSSGTVRSSTVVMSFIDTENFENPNVRYEVRVYSKAGLKIINSKELNLTVNGISKTGCRIEVRTLLDGRHSNPLSFGCNSTG